MRKLNVSEFTQGVCDDGAAILKDGKQLTIEQILTGLNRAEAIARSGHQKLNAFTEINAMCWAAKGKGQATLDINDVLAVLERYCDT
jgi:hypothetical protein